VHGTTRPGGAWESPRDIVYGPECDRFEPIVACSKAQAWRYASDVVFAGHQSDPVPYFAAMDVLVMPSRTEGFGRSAVEAMAMAKPVIASDVGALPEIVSNGLTGYNFRDGDVDALADRMNELAADEQKRATFGLRARALAEERFDLKAMLSKLQSIYTALLNGSEGQWR